jgi:hypothetical protein
MKDNLAKVMADLPAADRTAIAGYNSTEPGALANKIAGHLSVGCHDGIHKGWGRESA